MEPHQLGREVHSQLKPGPRARSSSPVRRVSNLAKLLQLVTPKHNPQPPNARHASKEVGDCGDIIKGPEPVGGPDTAAGESAGAGTTAPLATSQAQETASLTTNASRSSVLTVESWGSTGSALSTVTTAQSRTITVPVQSVYEIDKGLFIAPEIVMSDQHRQVFRQICSRLDDTLQHTFQPKQDSEAALSYEFVMAGPSPSRFKPTVLLVCCRESQKKHLKKILKTQKWIADYNYFWQVIVDPLQRLSRGSESPGGNLPVKARVPNGSSTILGALAYVDTCDEQPKVIFTMGGVIAIDGKLYGLTTGHAFQQQTSGFDCDIRSSHSADGDPVDDSDSDLGSPFVFSDDGDIEALDTANVVIRERWRGPNEATISGAIKGPMAALLAVDGHQEAEIELGTVHALPAGQDSLDWALIELREPERWQSNHFTAAGDSTAIEVTDILEASDPFQGDVCIIGGVGGLNRGTVYETPAVLHFDGMVFEAWQIMVEKPLALGESGSWVIQNGRLCGHIIARRQAMPWTYMIRIDKIFDQIMSQFKTRNVTILTRSGPSGKKPEDNNAPYALGRLDSCSRAEPTRALETAPSVSPDVWETRREDAVDVPLPSISIGLCGKEDRPASPQTPTLTRISENISDIPPTNSQRVTDLLQRIEHHNQQYLKILRALYEDLVFRNDTGSAEGFKTMDTSGCDSSSLIPLAPVASFPESASYHPAGMANRTRLYGLQSSRPPGVKGDGDTRSLTGSTLNSISIFEAESDDENTDDDIFVPLKLLPPTVRSRLEDDKVPCVQRILSPYSYTDEDLVEHIRNGIDESHEETKVALDYVWTRTKESDTVGLSTLLTDSSLDILYLNASYQVYDVGRDALAIQRHSNSDADADSALDAITVWDTIKSLTPGLGVAGRMTLLQEPSPMMLTAAHLAMGRFFDMDELYQHLVSSTANKGRTKAFMHRAFEQTAIRKQSFFFVFKYYTVVSPELSPAPWQQFDSRRPHDHIDIAECSSILALSLDGPPKKEVCLRSRKKRTLQVGHVADPFSAWHLLSIQCFPDNRHSLRSEDVQKPFFNGPYAFLDSLAAEYRDALKRFTVLNTQISKLVTPPHDFIFDVGLRDRLLFEDESFTYSRRYFWAYNTLGVLNDSIKAMVAAYIDTFTAEFWSGHHQTLWPLSDSFNSESLSYLKKMAALKEQIDSTISDLSEIIAKNERIQKKIASLREQLFNGSSVRESRRAIEQGDNIKILTSVSMMFLPLAFVTSVFGITEYHIYASDWRFAATVVCVAAPFALMIFVLETQIGMKIFKMTCSGILGLFAKTRNSEERRKMASLRKFKPNELRSKQKKVCRHKRSNNVGGFREVVLASGKRQNKKGSWWRWHNRTRFEELDGEKV